MEKKMEYEIIYKHNKPYGIRDKNGFLFFFTEISKYTKQEQRYRKEGVGLLLTQIEFVLRKLQYFNLYFQNKG